MAITYNSVSNRIFLDPDDSVDTEYTLDDIVDAQPTLITKSGAVYTINCHIVIAGTESEGKAILTATNNTLHFLLGTLGNDGGILKLGELYGDDEIPLNGCTIIYESDTSTHGSDSYKKDTDRDLITKQYPLCSDYGEIYMYNTQYKVVDQTIRNDMLDIAEGGIICDIRDCKFSGAMNLYASAQSYTHIYCVDTYLEDVKILNFGALEIGTSTTKEWKSVEHSIGYIGVSGFLASADEPVKLLGLTLKEQTTFGKRPYGSYVELTNLDYDGDYEFATASLQGCWKLLYTVDLTSTYDGVGLEGVRNCLTDTNNNITFDLLSDSEGKIEQQRAVAEVSETDNSTFNIQNNPFYLRAWKYGKKAIELPSTIDSSLTSTAFMETNSYITLTETEASAVDLTITNLDYLSLLTNSNFTDTTMIEALTGTEYGVWYTASLDNIYISDGIMYFRRNGDVSWNGGIQAFQNFTAEIDKTYTIGVNVLTMGDGSKLRFGVDGVSDYTITESGLYTFTFTATETDMTITLNGDPYSYTDHTQIEYFKIYEDDVFETPFSDDDGNSYSYYIDCEGNSVESIYHKLQYLWSIPTINTDQQYPLSSRILEAMYTTDGENYYGGKGVLFDNYTGSGLKTLTSDDDVVYTYPISYTLTLSNLIDGTDVVILESGTSTVLANVDQGGTSFSYTYSGTGTIDIGFVKQGYVTLYKYGYELSTNDVTLPIAQTVDRNYK